MRYIDFLVKMTQLCLRGKWVSPDDIGSSYDRVSARYDDYFLKTMHRYNEEMLCELPPVAGGARILDLACGTGFNSSYLGAKYPSAAFHLADLSEGMLAIARKRCPFVKEFSRKDMLDYLKAQESGSFDLVVCSWAIKYREPKQIIREVERILKPGGAFGVIVNKKDTLPEIRKIFVDLLKQNTRQIRRIMRELPNPKSKAQFIRWFTDARFKASAAGEGAHVFRFDEAEKLAAWATNTGALAGFDRMIDFDDQKVLSRMASLIRGNRIRTVTHTFVYGVFLKGGDRCDHAQCKGRV